jgi:predicted nucleotidyltransferase component of viral defense system
MNEELLKEAILRCSEYFLTQGIRIDEQNIEKDYYVCKMLSDLQKSDKADKFLFKGGTSLSKAWGIIK